MTLLAGKALKIVEHALAGPVSPAVGGYMVLNHAGQWLFSSRPWFFLRGGMDALDLVADQDWVELPPNIGAVLRIEQSTTYTRTFALTTPDVIQEYRATGIVRSTGTVWGCVTYDFADIEGTSAGTSYDVSPSTAAEQKALKKPTPRLDIYPSPTASSTGALLIYYRRGWKEVVEDTDTIFVPAFMEPLFLQAAVSFAQFFEEGDFTSLDRRLAELQAGPIYQAAAMADNGMQRELGRVRGGAAERRSYYPIGREGQVQGPL